MVHPNQKISRPIFSQFNSKFILSDFFNNIPCIIYGYDLENNLWIRSREYAIIRDSIKY